MDEAHSNREIVERSALCLPEDLLRRHNLPPDAAEQVLAAYLRQGLGPKGEPVAARFDPDAETVVSGSGELVFGELLRRLIPPEKWQVEPFLEHPEWAFLVARFGGFQGAEALQEMNFAVRPFGGKADRSRLGHILEAAPRLSPGLAGMLRRRGWRLVIDDDAVYFRLRWSPYSSCIPEGTVIGADGSGLFACGCREYHLRIVGDLRLKCIDPATGDVTRDLEAFMSQRSLHWACPETHEQVRQLIRYLRALTHAVSEVLEELYLLRRSLPAHRFRQLLADPLLQPYFTYLVCRQDSTDFMVADKGLERSDRTPYTLSEAPVSVPHPLLMDEDVLKAFRSRPKRSKPLLSQLREPVYDFSRLGPDMNSGRYGDPFFMVDSSGLRVDIGRDRIPPSLGRFVKFDPRQSAAFVWNMQPGDPMSNHLAYLVDMASADGRLARDDLSVLPLLSLYRPKQNLKKAVSCGAAQITAGLLETVKQSGRLGAVKDRDLTLD